MHICFLDIDGTLLLAGGAGQTAFVATLAEDFGVTEVVDGVAYAGRSDRAIATDLFALNNVELSPEDWHQFCLGYVARLEEMLPTHNGHLLPGVVELLDILASREDVAVGLLTGNVREAARRKLQFFGLWDYFSFGGFGDRHVDRNQIAAEALADAPKPRQAGGQIVVVGDTLNDIRCGRSIGARCVAVPTGLSSAETLREGEPDLLVETLAETEPILALFD